MIAIYLSQKNAEASNKAAKLGIKPLFCLPFSSKLEWNSIDAVLIEAANIKELNSLIAKVAARKKLVIVHGSNDAVNRAALESKRVWMLLSPEHKRKHDFLDMRNSGLNHVLCELARKNNVTIGESINEILEKQGKERAELLARIAQNIKLCRKYGCTILLLSCTNQLIFSSHEIREMAFSLGFSTQQLKELEKYNSY